MLQQVLPCSGQMVYSCGPPIGIAVVRASSLLGLLLVALPLSARGASPGGVCG